MYDWSPVGAAERDAFRVANVKAVASENSLNWLGIGEWLHGIVKKVVQVDLAELSHDVTAIRQTVQMHQERSSNVLKPAL
jgi:ABC-type antimicrobial peptide transport system permease subunit